MGKRQDKRPDGAGGMIKRRKDSLAEIIERKMSQEQRVEAVARLAKGAEVVDKAGVVYKEKPDLAAITWLEERYSGKVVAPEGGVPRLPGTDTKQIEWGMVLIPAQTGGRTGVQVVVEGAKKKEKVKQLTQGGKQ